jgi:predicted molibdopterin-dependent oxidoreductase YjgC
MADVTITVDGKKVVQPAGTLLIEACKSVGIEIPSFCYYNPIRGVQHVVAEKPETAQTTSAAKEDDPVELWKAVKRASVSAEVALANLYLEGKSVSQNCEQARVLLQTASMKSSKSCRYSSEGQLSRAMRVIGSAQSSQPSSFAAQTNLAGLPQLRRVWNRSAAQPLHERPF